MKVGDFDSVPEYEFWLWCQDAIRFGFIRNLEYHPKELVLAESVSIRVPKILKKSVSTKSRHVMARVAYQMDFMFEIDPSLYRMLPNKLLGSLMQLPDQKPCMVCIDIKPPPRAKSKYASSRSFPIKQKWLWRDHRIFVNEVNNEKFFKDTWVPIKVAAGIKVPIYKQWVGYRLTEDVDAMVNMAI